jgi:mono/diheme cytochrome c family protein
METSCFSQTNAVTRLTAGLAFLLFLLTACTPASAQDRDLIAAGKQEFRHSCVVCHGITGTGESVMTTLNLLAIKPPDLRQLRKRNKGTFPFWQIYQVIDGRQEIMAHGSRDMPIWGDVFIHQENGAIADDARAIGRILQLLYYLESIQQD